MLHNSVLLQFPLTTGEMSLIVEYDLKQPKVVIHLSNGRFVDVSCAYAGLTPKWRELTGFVMSGFNVNANDTVQITRLLFSSESTLEQMKFYRDNVSDYYYYFYFHFF